MKNKKNRGKTEWNKRIRNNHCPQLAISKHHPTFCTGKCNYEPEDVTTLDPEHVKAGKVKYNEYSKYNMNKLSIVKLLMSKKAENQPTWSWNKRQTQDMKNKKNKEEKQNGTKGFGRITAPN